MAREVSQDDAVTLARRQSSSSVGSGWDWDRAWDSGGGSCWCWCWCCGAWGGAPKAATQEGLCRPASLALPAVAHSSVECGYGFGCEFGSGSGERGAGQLVMVRAVFLEGSCLKIWSPCF